MIQRGVADLDFAAALIVRDAEPQPPGFKKGDTDKEWQAQDAPPGLTNNKSNRDWQGTPPGWTSGNSQGWQNSVGGTSGGRGKDR